MNQHPHCTSINGHIMVSARGYVGCPKLKCGSGLLEDSWDKELPFQNPILWSLLYFTHVTHVLSALGWQGGLVYQLRSILRIVGRSYLHRMDMGFNTGSIFWPLVLAWDPCPFGLPEILTGAHMVSMLRHILLVFPDLGLLHGFYTA